MTPKDFVAGIKAAVIDENISIYKELFSNTPLEEVTDDYWTRSLMFFNSLTTEQQGSLFEIIKQTMIDTTSNILGIIDGVNTFNGANDEFSLTYGKDSSSLAGDLQSLFLTEGEKIL